ncbi:MAG TPA: glycosyltransferase family 39 protein [Planctomycetaceae bacterium]|nr:glycosyltransferase family 39 protein [Planctomycetaceae bacterium]
MTLSSASESGSVAANDDSSASFARLGEFLSRTSVRLGLLLLACLVPRVIVACRLPAICDDGYSYLHVADSLQRGRLDQALEYLNLNIYPVVLMGLHKLGFEWVTAGKVWGVLMGTAIALPLFDWLRRVFDERIATVGVFLYAVQPKLIEYTVEPIREATFWFFLVLAIDFLWRSFDERRWWQFAVAGVALALALHTRVEGWFLLAPLAVWGAVSWWSAPAARLKLALGVILCLAMTPLLLLVMNLTLLAHHPTWELGRLSPFAVVARWIRPTSATASAANAVPTTIAPPLAVAQAAAQRPSPASQAPAPTSEPLNPANSVNSANSVVAPRGVKPATAALVRKYLIEIVRSVEVPFVALALIGFFSLLPRLRDPRVALLPVWTLVTLAAIWVQLSHIGEMNGRYFLTLAFVDAGFAAAGCLAIARWLTAIWQPANRTNRLVAAGLIPACLFAAGWTQAFSFRHTSRRTEAKLGRWTKAHTGPIHRPVSDFQAVRPAYFAAGKLPEVVKYDEFLEKDFDRDPPDLLVIDPRSFTPRLLPHFLERASDLGLVPLDQREFSSGPPKFLIYVRPQPSVARARTDGAPLAHVSGSAARN